MYLGGGVVFCIGHKNKKVTRIQLGLNKFDEIYYP